MIKIVWESYVEAQNITSVLELMYYGNTVTDGTFGMFIPFSIFVISLMMMYGRIKTENSIIVASYNGWIFALLLKVIGLVGDWVVVAFTVIVAVSVIAAMAHRKDVETS